MHKLTSNLKSMHGYSVALGTLEDLEKSDLREIAGDLGIYCQTRLTNTQITSKILCHLFGSRMPHKYTGATTGAQVLMNAKATAEARITAE